MNCVPLCAEYKNLIPENGPRQSLCVRQFFFIFRSKKFSINYLFTCLLTSIFVYLHACLLAYSITYLFTYLFVYLLACLLTQLLTYLLTP